MLDVAASMFNRLDLPCLLPPNILNPVAGDGRLALTSRDRDQAIRSGQGCARYLLGRIWKAAAQKGGHGIPASHDENPVAPRRFVERLECRAGQWLPCDSERFCDSLSVCVLPCYLVMALLMPSRASLSDDEDRGIAASTSDPNIEAGGFCTIVTDLRSDVGGKTPCSSKLRPFTSYLHSNRIPTY